MMILFGRLAASSWRFSMYRPASSRLARSALLLAAILIASGCGTPANPDPAGGPAPGVSATESPSASPAEEPAETDSVATERISDVTVAETIASGLEVRW